ncbi:hypothetical protein HPB49_006782 [Dermacentor silvarum]|uniref:Uncharacterized protein n=1 Tax=Dermacentor silvarum TaxID=543639 RepID=A0ACB8DWU8_DERSI|nr:hypothetical protein HPB49_006782 [Dermacentor silvarum]
MPKPFGALNHLRDDVCLPLFQLYPVNFRLQIGINPVSKSEQMRDSEGNCINSPGYHFQETFLGYVPTDDALNLKGLTEPINMAELMRVDKEFWLKECRDIKTFFDEQVGRSLPQAIADQLTALKERISKA